MIVLEEKYKDKITGEICTPKYSATCKNRGVEMVVYSDQIGKLYTLSVSEFEDRFKQINEIVLFKCNYKDIYSNMKDI